MLEHGSLEGIYENIDVMKASKMKENLINDKEQAFLSKTLATIDTKAPIEIGLEELVYSGPDVENLGKFYDEMGFKQLKQALNVSSGDVTESLDFTIVDQISQDMLSEESIFHFELFGENYHTDDLVGFLLVLWGKALCNRQAWAVARADFQGLFRKNTSESLWL